MSVNKYIVRAASVALAVLLIVSTIGATLCLIDREQHKTNLLKGSRLEYGVTLHKYEKAADGTVTERTVPGAEFYLYRVSEPEDVQIGGRYLTDENGRIAVQDIQPGDYYFLETNPTYAYTYDRDGGESVTRYYFNIGDNHGDIDVIVHAYNTRLDGGLVIAKTVEGTNRLGEEFEFTVTFSDNGAYTYKIDNGEPRELASGGKLYLKHGQKAIFEGIPVGVVYTVVETPAAGYTTASGNHQGTIDETGKTAGFTNTALPGSLTITKAVTGKSPDGNEKFEFTVTIGDMTETIYLAHGESKTYDNLPIGTAYTVTEKDYTAAGYITSPPTGYTGEITGDHALPFVNTFEDASGEPGHLKITKTVTGPGADFTKKFSFTVTFSGLPDDPAEILINGVPTQLSAANYQFPFALAHNESVLIENIPAGVRYTVEETREDEYRTSVRVNGVAIGNTARFEGAISSGSTDEIGFTNAKPEPRDFTLTVGKSLEGELPDGYEDILFHFVLEVEGQEPVPFTLKAGESMNFTVPAGAAYNVREVNIPEGWALVRVANGSGTVTEANLPAEFTNKYTDRIIIRVEGEKTWDAKGYNISLPESITLRLKKGDTVVETKTVRPGSNGKWAYSFDAPKYEADGVTEIVYTVEEIPVNSWKPSYNGYDVVNTYVPPVTLDSIPVEKTVTGGTPRTPAQFRFMLTAPGAAPMPDGAVNGVKTVTVTGAGTASFGSVTYILPGTYVYTISEVDTGADGYTYDVSIYTLTVVVAEQGGKLAVVSRVLTKNGNPADKAVFSNRYEAEDHTSVRVTKVWADGGSPGRPASVQVRLYRNGAAQGDPVTLNAANGWTHTWDNLAKGPVWTVDEIDIPAGYARTVSGDAVNGFTITNTKGQEPERASVKVTKVWADSGSPDRPKRVQAQLYKDGKPHGEPVTLNAANQWAYTWSGLEKGPNYTVDETAVPAGYAKAVTGSAAAGFTITNSRGGGPNPNPEQITISGSKTWSHGTNPEAQRPKSIVLYVKADGEIIRQKEITAADHWSWSIRVDKYAADGHEIAYAIDEKTVPDYRKAVSGFNLRNTYAPDGGGPGKPGNQNGPKTDDAGNLALWLALMAASFIGLAAILIFNRRRKRGTKKKRRP